MRGRTNLTGDGSILVSGANFYGYGLDFDVAAGQNLLRLGPPATNYSVHIKNMKSTKSYASNAFTLINIEGGASGTLNIDDINNTTSTATAVRYQSVTGKNALVIKNDCIAAQLVGYNFSAGDFHLDGRGSFQDLIIECTGTTGTYTVSSLYAATAGTIAVNTSMPINFKGNGDITSTTHGVLYSATFSNFEFVGGWKVSATGTNAEVITAITAANPAVVTIASHSFTNGQLVRLAGIVGMTELNGRTFTVANVATNTFELSGEDSTSYTAYTSDGTSSLITGFGVSTGAARSSRFTGIETSGFAIHIDVTFSDKCLVTNNIGRGAGTHINATSATNIVNRDNDLIA